MKSVSVAALFVLLFRFMQPAAADCMAQSGTQSMPLLELYTSEGCSSCPPADKWLSGLAGDGESARKVVPLAFHVDYWDYIGWKDHYAKSSYSERQRWVKALGGSTFVYTPQTTLNGKDFRGWAQASRFNHALETARNKAARASITIKINTIGISKAGAKANVEVSAYASQLADAKRADAYIAIYENKLKSQVNAGENSGRQLQHDYVVRELHGPYPLNVKISAANNPPLKTATDSHWQHSLALGPEWKNRDIGVAAFVQDRTNGEVLQALSLQACLD